MKYQITYLNLKTMRREYYLGKASFTMEEAKVEIVLLKQQEEAYFNSGFDRIRGKFQIKKIKL